MSRFSTLRTGPRKNVGGMEADARSGLELALALAGLVLVAAVLLSAMLWWNAQVQDQYALKASQQVVRGVLSSDIRNWTSGDMRIWTPAVMPVPPRAGPQGRL